jgi:protein TonB
MKTKDSNLSAGQENCQQAEVKNQDDIVFEKRNRNYGAFYLRSSYNKNVTRALFLAITVFLGIISIPLIAGLMNKKVLISNSEVYEMDPNALKPPVDKVEVPKPPDMPKMEKLITYTPPLVVDKDEDESTTSLMDLMNDTKNEPVNDKGNELLNVNIEAEKGPITFEANEKPLIIVECPPCFIGGDDAMYKWLGENIKYPQEARESGISGTVVVTFVVEKDGSITNVEPLNKIGGGCEQEAVRVVKLMPKWRGGKQNNMPVRVQFNLPIKFTLNMM